jgi:hypothetical protein
MPDQQAQLAQDATRRVVVELWHLVANDCTSK